MKRLYTLVPTPGGWAELVLPRTSLNALLIHHTRYLITTRLPTWLIAHTAGRLLRRRERLP